MATAYAYPRLSASLVQDAPSSPTLTNPDMILPWQADHSSPAPVASSPTLHSEPSLTRLSQYRSHSAESRSNEQSQAEVGVARTVMMPFRTKPATQTTITTPIYYEHGAPLSDIFEEESTPKSKRTRSRTPSPTNARSPTRRSSGPTLRHKKRLSNTSDLSNGSDVGNWEDFDSSKMMNARLAADVARADDDNMTDADGLESKRNSVINTAEDEMAVLNQRAEKILANAKKRLTHMEDNLSKARNSIFVSPKTSPVVGEHQPVGGLYRSISQGGDRRLGQGYTMRKSKSLYPVVKTIHTGHIRGLSDNSASYGLTVQSPQIRSASALELSSRMDSMNPESSTVTYTGHSPSSSRSYNSPMRNLEEENEGSPSTDMTSPHTPPSATRGLGISNSSPTNQNKKRQTPTPPLGHNRSSSQASTQSTRELSDQMNSLKTRISDLKQKAQSDSLRRQSQQSLRTPSPFTHAPEQWYTEAPEYREASKPINNKAGLGWSPSREYSNLHRSPTSPKDSVFGEGRALEGSTPMTIRTDVNTPNLARKTVDKLAPQAADYAGTSFAQGSHYEDAEEEFDDGGAVATSQEEQVYLNEALEESLQNAEPDIPIILDEDFMAEVGREAERHEDRVDAFDYENMFLHSALGNYRGHHQRDEEEDEGSDTEGESEGSVETRRAVARTPVGPDDEEDDEEEEEECGSSDGMDSRRGLRGDYEEPPTPRANALEQPLRPPMAPWMKAARSNSMDSVTTTATFATATEGYGDAEEEDEEYESPSEILSWGNMNGDGGMVSPGRTRDIKGWPTPPVNINGNNNVRPVSRGKEKQLVPNGGGLLKRIAEPLGSVQPPQQQPANTEILMASLITLADPSFSIQNAGGNVFADVDKQLVISLLRAVGAVCGRTLRVGGDGQGEREVAIWRGRLEGARRVLERGSDELHLI